MDFKAFRRVERLNPTTGEVIQKVVVVGDDNIEYSYLTNLSVDEIKANRDTLLASCRLIDTKYGKCAVSSSSTLLEEF